MAEKRNVAGRVGAKFERRENTQFFDCTYSSNLSKREKKLIEKSEQFSLIHLLTKSTSFKHQFREILDTDFPRLYKTE